MSLWWKWRPSCMRYHFFSNTKMPFPSTLPTRPHMRASHTAWRALPKWRRWRRWPPGHSFLSSFPNIASHARRQSPWPSPRKRHVYLLSPPKITPKCGCREQWRNKFNQMPPLFRQALQRYRDEHRCECLWPSQCNVRNFHGRSNQSTK